MNQYEPESPNPIDENPIDENQDQTLDDSQRCVLYLLGELDPVDAAATERQLETSAEFAEQMLRQADFLVALDRAQFAEPVAPASNARWPLIASLLAIAACVAIVFTLQMRPERATSVADASEDLLIAQAWADSLTGDASGDAEFADIAVKEFELTVAEENSEEESALSWMFVAVSADIQSHQTGANDG